MASLTTLTMIVSGLMVPLLSFVFFRWVRPALATPHFSIDILQIPGHQLPPLIYNTVLIQLTSVLVSRWETYDGKKPQ